LHPLWFVCFCWRRRARPGVVRARRPLNIDFDCNGNFYFYGN
jgi:hypothetical protein